MPRLYFVFEQRVERVGVGTKLTKMSGGSTLSQFVLTTALMAADDAKPLQITHYSGIGLSQSLRIDGKCDQHLP